MVLQMQNHSADVVGRIIGHNPGTGGSIPEGSSALIEGIRVLGGEFTVHNCYERGDKNCQKYWGNQPGSVPRFKPASDHSQKQIEE